MLTVRLSRVGTRNLPFYHIVVTDSASARDGNFIEQIGTCDPLKPGIVANVKQDRLDHWVKLGAKPSDRVANVLRGLRLQAAAAQPTAS
jgi:small subunit ribosomal protein S16